MKKIWKALSGLFFVVALLGTPVFALEMADNPAYQQWAKFKVGDSVKYKQVSEVMGNQSVTETTHSLIESTPEKVVVEMKSVSEVMGTKTEIPPMKMEHSAKSPKVDTVPMPGVVTTQGEEEITVPAGTFKCQWTETKIENEESSSVSKVHYCEGVPGGLVKSTTSMTKPVQSTTTMELITK